jgi:hypothetical protein
LSLIFSYFCANFYEFMKFVVISRIEKNQKLLKIQICSNGPNPFLAKKNYQIRPQDGREMAWPDAWAIFLPKVPVELVGLRRWPGGCQRGGKGGANGGHHEDAGITGVPFL